MSTETKNPPLSLAMVRVCDLAFALGVRDLNKRPDCWEHQIDSRWWIAVNGRSEPTKCTHGPMVQPYQCYIEFNGFPAGIIDPYGGCIAAGEVANEDSFVEAVEAATKLAGGELTQVEIATGGSGAKP